MVRHKHQAKEGDVMVGAAARYVHGDQAAGEVAEDIRQGIKEMIAFNVLPATAKAVRWTAHNFPAISNTEILEAEPAFWQLGETKMRHVLMDASVQTAVEAGDGHFPAVLPHRREGRLSSPAQLAAIFDESILPAALQHTTRTGYHASWKMVIAWAVAHDEVASLLPMSQLTLKAMTQELLMVGCAAGTIRNVWSAIEDRHRRFGYLPPLAIEGEFSRLARAVGSVSGQPSRLIFPIGVHHVQMLMELAGLNLTQRRDMLICVVGTTGCLRVGEVENLQICDAHWEHDAAWDAQYEGTMALGVYKRKQDQIRKGLYPRHGKAVTDRLREFVRELGLEVSEECSKERSPGARCRTCPPLFPRIVAGSKRSQPVSRQQVTRAVLNSLKMLGVDTKHFSGLSMRRGGISAALVARVPEPILFLQSGHGSNCAARNYMVPRNPHILFETYNAFGL
jgi:integrase